MSSVGIIRNKNLPGTQTADHICYFRHALALDERRVKFLPEYILHSNTSVSTKTNAIQSTQLPVPALPSEPSEPLATPLPSGPSEPLASTLPSEPPVPRRVKEVWFAGTHSDM